MSDSEQKTPAKASSGGAWSDQEKIAYLLVLCDHVSEGKAEGKTNTCPVPVGRTTLSCRKLVLRMKEKYKEDMERIKAGQPIAVGTTTGDGETAAAPEKAKTTPRKRKTKAEAAGDANANIEGSPKKKTAGRQKAVAVKEEVKEDEIEDVV